MSQKIVINRSVGGFCLSKEAVEELQKLGYADAKYFYHNRTEDCWQVQIARDHPLLVQVVKMLGKKANGKYGELKIVEIPDNVEWEIHDSEEGLEWVAEEHRTWC